MMFTGHVVGEKITAAIESHTGEIPIIIYSCSGGGGDDFTDADGEDFSRTQKHHEYRYKLPYRPTMGGVSARLQCLEMVLLWWSLRHL